MTAQAGTLLVEEIAPRLRTLVPKSVKPVGAEDEEELLQDAITIAAQMLHRVEEQGKAVTPGNIAFYTVLHMRSGRRSQGSSRVDTMGVGTQLDGSSSVLSLEEEVGYDPELDQPITLGELLASEHEDPSMEAARNIDWELFIATHDYRYGIMIKGIVEGQSLKAAAGACANGFGNDSKGTISRCPWLMFPGVFGVVALAIWAVFHDKETIQG